MARVLAISSQVARGHVGLSATALALERLGHEVWRLPTILLSNHPGHPRTAAVATPPDKLAAMIDALGANGWLEEVDAVLTGYLPSAAHVAVAAEAVTRVRARAARAVVYVCDPVLGDDPKGLYIAVEAAAAIRERSSARSMASRTRASRNGFGIASTNGVLSPARSKAR